jgi:hypothetical protein
MSSSGSSSINTRVSVSVASSSSSESSLVSSPLPIASRNTALESVESSKAASSILVSPVSQRQLSRNVSGLNYLSEVELAVLRATTPLSVNETESITVNGETGQWLNKNEVANWKGDIPLTEYEINVDSEPEIITKKTSQKLEYVQELAIRYLRPPT